MEARLPTFVLSLTPILLFAACSDAPSTTPPPGTTTPSGTQAAAPQSPMSTPLPADHPPVAKGGAVTFTAPEGWVSETPSSAMRKAQFKLPHQGADTEDAKLVVYYFGAGQGGPVDENLNRWAGEYEQPDGRKSADVMTRSTRKVGGMDVTEMDVSGTCIAETAPGSGERVRKENWRTLAAIVQSPGGSYFVKLMGPAATVAHWEPSFRQYISSAKSSG
jgi:hypothetical protein